MATTYDPAQGTAKDRVRFLVDDRSAPFRFQDEEITYTLSLYSGTTAEIEAAIYLLESSPATETSTTQKQGSWSRTSKLAGSQSRLAWLKDKLATATISGAWGGIGTADMEMPTPQELPQTLDGRTFFDTPAPFLFPTE